MKVSVGVITGIGKVECEDAAFCNEVLVDNGIHKNSNFVLKCIGVADGVGGNAGGKIASKFVASEIIHTDFSQMVETQIQQFAEGLNLKLIRYAATIPEKAEMATTLTCVVAASDGIYLIHSGNTRIYVAQGSYLKQLTNDQTTYNWLMESGQYEAANQCNKSEITGCFGGGDPQYAKRMVVSKLFAEGLPDTMLLTSDGIHEYVDVDTMESALFDATLDEQQIIQHLVGTAVSNGSTDDKTVIIARR